MRSNGPTHVRPRLLLLRRLVLERRCPLRRKVAHRETLKLGLRPRALRRVGGADEGARLGLLGRRVHGRVGRVLARREHVPQVGRSLALDRTAGNRALREALAHRLALRLAHVGLGLHELARRLRDVEVGALLPHRRQTRKLLLALDLVEPTPQALRLLYLLRRDVWLVPVRGLLLNVQPKVLHLRVAPQDVRRLGHVGQHPAVTHALLSPPKSFSRPKVKSCPKAAVSDTVVVLEKENSLFALLLQAGGWGGSLPRRASEASQLENDTTATRWLTGSPLSSPLSATSSSGKKKNNLALPQCSEQMERSHRLSSS